MTDPQPPVNDECSTIEAARLLGLAVRSVQLMVDRGELTAWKTPGGHRRISRASVDAWMAGRARGGETAEGVPLAPVPRGRAPVDAAAAGQRAPKLLLIEDSAHYQNLISLLVRQSLPEANLLVATDGIAGLAIAGREQPDVLIIDILLPGIDGATLVTSLRSQPPFSQTTLVIVTSLDAAQREPYAFALQDLPVIHKSRLVAELPPLLQRWRSHSNPAPSDGA
jgi:excisionase family DNA binding protein